MTTILIKKKDTAGVPAPGDLTNAAGGTEIAVNTATKRIYTKDSGGNVVELGTNPSTIDATTVDTTNLEVTNIKAKDGTASIVLADSTGVATINAAPVMTALTASQAVFTTAGKALVSNPITGTGNVVMSASPTLTGTVAGASLQLSSLTSGRVTYSTTAGLLTDSANLLYAGADLTVYGLTVGRGAGAQANNTAVGASAFAANTTGNYGIAIGNEALKANTTGQQNSAAGGYTLVANTTGSYNAGFGTNALLANTTGSNNTALGTDSLYNNTTASNNTAVGYQAGYSNTTGQVTAFGALAAKKNTTASGITAIGFASLAENTTGSFNTALGIAVLNSNTTGSNNVGVGGGDSAALWRTLERNTTGSYNTAVGISALGLNTTASSNTAVGYQAAYSQVGAGGPVTAVGNVAARSNTTGRITAIGSEALFANTTGTLNTAVGDSALDANTTGSNNTAIGQGALTAATTASNNTAVGYLAAGANTTGTENQAFGAYALDANTTGNSNSAFGLNALGANTTASDNSAYGVESLRFNTTGASNTAVGKSALQSNTTASYNTAVGYQAGYAVTTGQYNTIIGEEAGKTATTASNNTFLGQAAGYNATGGRNTFLGIGAGSAVTSGASNTIIGNYAGNNGGLDIRTANNYIVLSDGDGNPRATWFPNGWVFGYPTYTPLADEQVVAADNANGSMSAFFTAAAPNGGQSGVRLRAGVGTTYRATRVDFYQTPVSTTIPRWTLINDYNQDNTNDFRLYSGLYGNPVQTWKGDGTTSVYNTLGVGNTAGSTSGAGITFPATQSASSNANTLDDYEEGTWTPTITGASSNPTVTYSVQYGRYTKIGNVVYLSFRVQFSYSGGSGALQISGLPFTAANNIQMKSTLQQDNITFTGYDYLDISANQNTSTLGLGKNRSGNTAAGLQVSDCSTSNTDINGGVYYFV